ncbi:RING/FYVE/PHD zinc finger superfamily protein [Actinidia rufa]|uniref:RING/FYVE/PHD zinc finger superfamily protein n=1 Tax=Actinidia rufa TaxID=165716 RepID=A0A7J0DL82_9ERIC|nr:RING/FYVE/PHD zinc finger superfamily protein [Actinidia rufa]
MNSNRAWAWLLDLDSSKWAWTHPDGLDSTVYSTLTGVIAFFVLLEFFGIILHRSSLNGNDPRMAGCQNFCYGWGILDCFPASMEACFALDIVFVVVFAILGIAYGFLAATMAIQRIWQRHYHILTKRELTKEYIVEDLHGCYSPPKLDPEHEGRLKMLKLL